MFLISHDEGLRQDNLNGKRMEIMLFVITAYHVGIDGKTG